MGLRTPMSGNMIELWSGGFLNLSSPNGKAITAEDVATGLSNCCRFAGQSRRFYSVAEHSILVHDLVASVASDWGLQFAALMHDAAEAFIGDMTAPLKYVMRSSPWELPYDRVSYNLDRALAKRFGYELDLLKHPLVQQADQWAFVIEARSLLASCGSGYAIPPDIEALGGLPPGVLWDAGMAPGDARMVFLQTLKEYTGSG